jgi:hypothetical protein
MWTAIFIVGIIILLIGIAGSNGNKVEHQTLVLADNEMAEKGFIKEATSIIDNINGKTILCWDKQNEKIAIIAYQRNNYRLEIFDYKAIRDAEIIKDGETVFKKSAMRTVGGAVIGGALLGGVGAIVGGLSGAAKGVEKIKTLTLKIYFNNVEEPSKSIEFINKYTIRAEDKLARVKEAEKWKDRLIAIIDKEKTVAQQQVESKPTINISVADELKKYKELLDAGALTTDEFNAQKAKLLS